jgi:hypothetical protein
VDLVAIRESLYFVSYSGKAAESDEGVDVAVQGFVYVTDLELGAVALHHVGYIT